MQWTLKTLRVNKNLTQEEASKKLGISPSTLSKWENYKSFPNAAEISKIEKLYGVGYNDIIFLPTNTV